ncbi:MAG: ABC transporter substrate-binding protein, partial [Bacteroidaceae bacterium]|nr:ABC transporter substrate-binding protein [Bacteroidaceae bacterium]
MEGGDTIRMSHAKLLTIIRHKGFTEAQIADPWNSGRVLHKYILITKGQSVPDEGAEGHTVVNLPLQSMLVSTAAHCALFGELGMQQCVTGVCEPEYIHQNYVSEGIRSGSIMDCGLASQPNVENIVNLSPDAILLSPFQGTTDYGKVSQLGIPIIELADYMELSPLGRAEWIKFYGMLVGKKELADSLFAKVEREYNDCIQLAKAQKYCPTVMMDKMVQATWYVPGGQSTMGQMLKDANCQYVYADDEHSGSLTLS